MKKFLLIIIIILLTGCTNKEETTKNEYIAMKNNLIKEEINIDKENLPLDVITEIDRLNEEEIIYKVILKNPKENMHNIKIMLIHNQYSEEIFPSVGVFDEKKELLKEAKDNKIELTGKLKTIENISKMNFQIKLLIQYINDLDEKKEIYYKTT